MSAGRSPRCAAGSSTSCAGTAGWCRDERPGDDETEPVGPLVSSLADLPDTQRVAMVLMYVDDLSVAEIAAVFGRSEHAVESLLARGRAALRAKGRGAFDAG
ncbi:MAG: sigma-70 region 4 domain-containing protein [Ilumatobacteraceae bacterium]